LAQTILLLLRELVLVGLDLAGELLLELFAKLFFLLQHLRGVVEPGGQALEFSIQALHNLNFRPFSESLLLYFLHDLSA